MNDISVLCDCGKIMKKIEDGRERHTVVFNPLYPKRSMEFVCPCGKAVDISWVESVLHDLSKNE